jgi:large subunit ribosomal protein L29
MGRPRDVERTKAMNATELREKTPDQLRDQLTQLKKEAFNLRFQQATGQLENTARMRVVKRDAARVLTILNEKAAAAAGEAN